MSDLIPIRLLPHFPGDPPPDLSGFIDLVCIPATAYITWHDRDIDAGNAELPVPAMETDPSAEHEQSTSAWRDAEAGESNQPHLISDQLEIGTPVRLPNGQYITDDRSPSGHLMSPVADLAPIAAAGRNVGVIYRSLDPHNEETAAGAAAYLALELGLALGHRGKYDYQRNGNNIVGFVQCPQFAHVSNFNVGLFCQQAGLTLK